MLKRLFGIGLAAAILMVAGPSMAVVVPLAVASDTVLTEPAPTDCLASFNPASVMLLVEVESGCDTVLAEVTGLCLAPAPAAPTSVIVGVLDPDLGVSCTNIRPSPPG